MADYPGLRWAVLQTDYTVVFAGKRHLRNKRSEASAVMVKLKKARTIGRIQTSSSVFILTVNSAMAEVSELDNLLAAKIIIQTVIRRCEVCNSTGFFLA